jgi:hypothetical protein
VTAVANVEADEDVPPGEDIQGMRRCRRSSDEPRRHGGPSREGCCAAGRGAECSSAPPLLVVPETVRYGSSERRREMIATVTRVCNWIAQHCCHHDEIRRAGAGRFWMECRSCGRRSPGITVRRDQINLEC